MIRAMTDISDKEETFCKENQNEKIIEQENETQNKVEIRQNLVIL